MHRSLQSTARRAWRRLAGASLLGLLAALPNIVVAQSATYGALSGSVVDAASRPVADASIRLIDRASGAVRRAVTARDGAFKFAVLSPAEYDLAVEALGFRPVVHLGVGVAAGNAPSLRVTLVRERPPVMRVDTVRASGARVEPGAWMFARGFPELAGGRRTASDAALLSTVADEDAIEGLPWRHADLIVDGVRVGSVGAMGLGGNATQALALPARAMAAVSAGGTGLDVELGGSGVGLTALSARGGGSPVMRLGTFGGTSDVGGAFSFAGPVQGDTAQAIAGVDYQRSEIVRPAWFEAGDAEGNAIAAVANTQGRDLSVLTRSGGIADERASGFGRLDWQLNDKYAILARAAGSRAITRDMPVGSGIASPFGARREATAAQLSIGVLSRLSRRLSSELRVSGDVGDATSESPSLDATTFAGRGITLGGAGDDPSSDKRAAIRAAATFHWDLGSHLVKVGGAVASHRFESRDEPPGAGTYAFGDAVDFAAANGGWTGLAAHGGSGSYRMLERSAFVQDAWSVADGLAVTLGMRIDGATVPVGDITPNAAWLLASGIDNTAVSDSRVRIAPRFSFRWELGSTRSWSLSGGAGVFNDLVDRRDVAAALAYDEGVDVRSGLGALGIVGSWPGVPGTGVAPSRGDRLALLGPDMEGPRTRRMSLTAQRDAGAWSLYVRGTYRYTDFLGRRRDLNLPAGATGLDQDGRPLYGTLQQLGSLVAATPGSNRRFGAFDQVLAIEATGFSEYTAVTAGVERVVPAGLSYGVHATYSKAEDNLASRGLPLAPLPIGASGREWSEGVADGDAPLRVVAATEWSASASGVFRLGVVYRGRSGAPFTPGFRPGVDANGDGIAGNDPAFVNSAVSGMTALLDANTCLAKFVGAFAERNSCRGDWRHSVDVRATLRLANLAAGPLDLVVDAMDLLPVERGRIDDALYLVDRTGTLSTSLGVTTVPLVANPAFGTIVADRAAGPLFRVGLRIGR